MGFGQEMKDFVSAFKTGTDILDKMDDNAIAREKLNKKSFQEKQYERDQAELEQARATGEGEYNRRRASTSTPGAVDTGTSDTQGSPGMDGDNTISSPASAVPTAANAFNPDYNAKLVRKESGGNPDAQNSSSSAGGLHQFTDGTWSDTARKNPQLGLTPGGKFDPAQSTKAAGALTKDNAVALERAGHAPTQANKYLAHFMGAGGAKDFLSALQSDPNMNAAGLFPREAKANRSIFYGKDGRSRSVGEVYNALTAGFSKRTAALDTGEGDVVAYAATGGLIDPAGEGGYPDVTSDGNLPKATERPLPKGAALPVNESARPAPRDTTSSDKAGSGSEFNPREFVNLDQANEAAAAGLDTIQKSLIGGAGVPEAAEDRSKKIQAFARGEGSGTPDDIKEIDSVIDPKNELEPHLKSIARLNGVYQMYLRKGEPQKAAAAAASIVEYTRKVAMSGGAQIQALVEKGNMAGAAKVMQKTYEELPNGHKIEVKPTKNGIDYKVFDIDGNPTDGGRMAMDEILRLATGLQDGTTWMQGLGYMAGQYKNRRATAGGNPRQPAAPRTTAGERALATEKATEAAGVKAREDAYYDKGGQLAQQAPDLTPSTSNAPQGVALPNELAMVEGVPNSTQPTYNAGTGIRRVMPEEGQTRANQSTEETLAGNMSVINEFNQKNKQLDTAKGTEDALAKADKAYAARVNRKGVRISDSSGGREKAAESFETGFQSVITPEGKKPTPIAADKKNAINTIASRIVRANEGLSPEDAGRTIGEIMLKGPVLKPDGSVGAKGSTSQSVFLDAQSIKSLVQMYGGKLPSVAGVDTSLTPREYKMPAQGGPAQRSASSRAIADAMRGNTPKEPEQPRRNRYSETWRKRKQEED